MIHEIFLKRYRETFLSRIKLQMCARNRLISRVSLLTLVARPVSNCTHHNVWRQVIPHQIRFSRKYNGDDSREFKLPDDAVPKLLDRYGHKYKIGSEWHTVQVCIAELCEGTASQKSGRDKPGNLHVLGIHRRNGTYHCFRCGASGSWKELLKRIGEYDRDPESIESPVASTDSNGLSYPIEEYPHHPSRDQGESLSGLWFSYTSGLKTCLQAKQWLTEDIGLAQDILEKFCIGAAIYEVGGEKRTCVTFPQDRLKAPRDIVRIRACALQGGMESATDPPVSADDPACLFGWAAVPDGAEHLVITNREVAAMAVHQETGLPAVSVGDGPAAVAAVTGDVIRALDSVALITLWLADDPPGRQAAASLAAKLGRSRCRVVWTRAGGAVGPRDAADLLAAHRRDGGDSLGDRVRAAGRARHEAVVTFEDLRAEVRAVLSDPAAAAGTRFGAGLAGLNETLKGHRPGELTVVRCGRPACAWGRKGIGLGPRSEGWVGRCRRESCSELRAAHRSCVEGVL